MLIWSSPFSSTTFPGAFTGSRLKGGGVGPNVTPPPKQCSVGKNPEVNREPVCENHKNRSWNFENLCEILKIVCEILKILCEIMKTVCEILKIVCEIMKTVCEIRKIVCDEQPNGSPAPRLPFFFPSLSWSSQSLKQYFPIFQNYITFWVV